VVIRPCEPPGSSWLADYRSYAVELHRKIEGGVITKQNDAGSSIYRRLRRQIVKQHAKGNHVTRSFGKMS